MVWHRVCDCSHAAQSRWTMHHIPSNIVNFTPDQGETTAVFADYVAAAFIDASHKGTFDLISIDGRARVGCFPRALELIKPHGGVLVLDNSERPNYTPGVDLVPRQWLRYEFATEVDTTTVWVSIQEAHG